MLTSVGVRLLLYLLLYSIDSWIYQVLMIEVSLLKLHGYEKDKYQTTKHNVQATDNF